MLCQLSIGFFFSSYFTVALVANKDIYNRVFVESQCGVVFFTEIDRNVGHASFHIRHMHTKVT